MLARVARSRALHHQAPETQIHGRRYGRHADELCVTELASVV